MFSSNKYNLLTISSSQIKDLNISTPECQRAIDSEQVNKIVSYQVQHYNNYSSFFFTNPIHLAEFEGKIYILDGQHRIKAIQRLRCICKTDFDIHIVYVYVNSLKELEDYYIAINQNKPVPLPSNMDEWKQFTRHIDQYLQQNYSIYFSKSQRPVAPNFNKENLLQYIDENNIAKQINCDFTRFIQELEELNNFYRETYSITLTHLPKNILSTFEKARKKQPNRPFFLSIFKKFEWIDRIVFKITQNKEYNEMNHVSSNTRFKIKKKLRKEVWKKKYCETITGKCDVCNEQIEYDNSECGHIISVFYNGNTTLDNLMPICGSCNRDMGIKNLETYKKELKHEIN